MKTHWKPGEGASPLPPPPAPTASDANPWPMPQRYGDRPSKPTRPAAVARPHPKAPFGKAGSPTRTTASTSAGSPATQPSPSIAVPSAPTPRIQPPRRNREAVRGLPLLIILGAMVAAAVAARRAIASGDFAGAIGPVLVAVIIAFSWWQRSRHR